MFVPIADFALPAVRAGAADTRYRSFGSWGARVLALCIFLALVGIPSASAQISGAIGGTVADESGAVISGAKVIAKNMDTTAEREVTTETDGHYRFSVAAIGTVRGACHQTGLRHGSRAREFAWSSTKRESVDLTLKIGAVTQQITVEGDAPMVSVTTQDISGLVGEQQVKDLPLNGRSYDLLLPFNPGIVNFTSQKTGGTGVSNSTTANNFAVSGNRPQQNLFLLNGVEFTGAAENNMTPGGASGELLGVEAVREFNVLRDSYGAEYGKKPGGQVIIVTQSGTNQLHGSLYEFVRNSALDAPNFFDSGFGSAFRAQSIRRRDGRPRCERTRLSSSATTRGSARPESDIAWHSFRAWRPARSSRVPSVVPLLKSVAHSACQRSGFQRNFARYSAAHCRRFAKISARRGSTRFSSPRDSLVAIYTVDDGGDVTATIADPYSTDILNLREQVLSLEETHVFSPNVAQYRALRFFPRRLIFSRANPRPVLPLRVFRDSSLVIRLAPSWSAEAPPPTRRLNRAWREQQRKQFAYRAKSIHV